MDPQSSPPKRVTRAKAAAKDTKEPKLKITTAAARAKASKANPAPVVDVITPAATRRRTRAADHAEEAQEEVETKPAPTSKPKATRGRPKKITLADVAKQAEDEAHGQQNDEEAVAALVKPTRGRPKKVEQVMEEPARPGRGRPRKIVEEAAVVEAPVKKATRGRPAAPKPGVLKKSVKFGDQVDKENIPVAASSIGKEEANTGLSAKPIRRAPPTRSTRGKPTPASPLKSSPLSPKKITQVSPAKEVGSEDELATAEKTPMKPLTKSVLDASKKLEFTTSIIANRAILPERTDLGASIMASPARRLPQSPYKDAMKSSPTRVPSNNLLRSPFKPSFSAVTSAGPSQPSFKNSLMQSPARRPPSPMKNDLFNGTPANFKMTGNSSKNTIFQSQARRPASPSKVEVTTDGSPGKSKLNAFGATPRASTFSISKFATPRTANRTAFRPGKLAMVSPVKIESVSEKADGSTMKFAGRLSAVMPRSADVDISENAAAASSEHQVDFAMEDVAEEEVKTQGVSECDALADAQSTTPMASPPRHSTGVFGLRSNDLDPYACAVDSESEDELASASPQYSPVPLRSMRQIPATPKPFMAIVKTPLTKRSTSKMGSDFKIGFTPLAKQLSDWMGASPEKRAPSLEDSQDMGATSTVTPARDSTFFADEMEMRDEEIMVEDLVLAGAHSDLNEILGITSEEYALPEEEIDIDGEIDAMTFAPAFLDEQDLELAAEAEEMSLLDFEAGNAAVEESEDEEELETEEDEVDALEIDQLAGCSSDFRFEQAGGHAAVEVAEAAAEEHRGVMNAVPGGDATEDDQFQEHEHEADRSLTVSDASQEYGDENATPFDTMDISPTQEEVMAVEIQQSSRTPVTLPTPTAQTSSFQTPVQGYYGNRVVHTVSKVPLKAPADESPIKVQARGQTVARLPTQRGAPQAQAMARTPTRRQASAAAAASASASATRSATRAVKSTPAADASEEWSTAATPTKTPRPDVNPGILKGAVVFVDVHTTEGADASAVFVELLTCMGARCVKTWPWSPQSNTHNEASDSKIGITHVVFKDGGTKTMEKVRATNGVVQCLGVGWVLDCERTNSWVSEAPYEIDTALVPRGGHRRRKSMEPTALRNVNNGVDATPKPTPRSVSYNQAVEAATPSTVKNKDSYHRRKSTAWMVSPSSSSSSPDELPILSPVPATPAPEQIREFADHVLDGVDGEPTPYTSKEELLQRTMPVARTRDGGAAEAEDRQKGVLMQRLMLARRKSLQWAPKVGSPLAKRGEWS